LMTQNSYQVSHHSQGGMKFATQISPLLNLFIYLDETWQRNCFADVKAYKCIDQIQCEVK
jgi:hypothetical protein